LGPKTGLFVRSRRTAYPQILLTKEKDIHQIAVLEEDPVQDRYDFALDQVGV
jgi:hypothetical protein